MIVDRNYKISVFGNFTDIIPTPENIAFLVEVFRHENLMPSIFQEVKIDNNNPQIPQQQSRIALISADSTEQIAILSERIDYEIRTKTDVEISDEVLETYNEKIKRIFNVLFDHFKKQSTRLALNTENYVINLSDDEVVKFLSKFSNPISVYTEKEMKEWNTRLMIRKEIPINDQSENFNIITIIAKIPMKKIENNVEKNFSGFTIMTDINTVAENTSSRFGINEVSEFMGLANSWWKKIITEIHGAI